MTSLAAVGVVVLRVVDDDDFGCETAVFVPSDGDADVVDVGAAVPGAAVMATVAARVVVDGDAVRTQTAF